jgi:AcrR family transcriptional regulator
MAEVSAERGVANVTVAHVVTRSGVSRRTFYEVFEDCEDCCLAAFDEALARASRYVLEAYDPRTRWVERVRAALLALLEFLDDEPSFARLAVIESLGAGPATLKRRASVLACLADVVDEGGREEAKSRAEPPPLTAEGVVGAVYAVIHARMLEENDSPLVELLNPLMATIVLPYLGAAASRRELSRPGPKTRERTAPVRSGALSALEIRLTYRTMRALSAIGAQPGSSNREVADAAGVTDPGQISKLLMRLSRLGLIETNAVRSMQGEPNAWRLTHRGEEIRDAVAW